MTLWWPTGGRASEADRIALFQRVAPAVVCILDPTGEGGGSGVVIAPDGTGLTNYHVVRPLLPGRQGKAGLPDGKTYPLDVLGIDPTGDVAMFRLSGRDRFEHAELGDSHGLSVGDPVYAAGNPFALAEDFSPTFTMGIVSGLHRYQFGADARSLVYTDCIQTDASINPGNSGGPLFDASGRVVGINGRASFHRRGRVNVGLAYAIAIHQIKRFLPGLEAGLLVEHGALGATTTDAGYGQVIFDRVLADSPAAKVGIEVGDALLTFQSEPIHSANAFLNLVGTYPAGWPVTVTWSRNGQVFTAEFELERLPVELPQPLQGVYETEIAVTRAAAQTQADANKHGPPGWGIETGRDEHTRFALAYRGTVKLYGGAIGTEVGYGTGVVVSEDGGVLTALSAMLEARRLRAVAFDGHVFDAEVVQRDAYRQLALLQLAPRPRNPDTTAPLDAQMQPARWFPLTISEGAEPRVGDTVFAVGNPFKVAEGRERMSVTQGIVAGRLDAIDARRNAQPHPYRGPAIVVDMITSNPGSAGGALLDHQGRWIGLIGETVTAVSTNTELNYAYPPGEITAFLADAVRAARAQGVADASADAVADDRPGYHGIRLSRIGYRRRLPFVRRVADGSPADKAGVRPNDLIVSINGVAVPRARVFSEQMERCRVGEEVALVIKRDDQLVSVRFVLTEEPSP